MIADVAIIFSPFRAVFDRLSAFWSTSLPLSKKNADGAVALNRIPNFQELEFFFYAILRQKFAGWRKMAILQIAKLDVYSSPSDEVHEIYTENIGRS